MSLFPKWDGEAKPPLSHVIGHRLLGPPIVAAVALKAAWLEGLRKYRDTYDALRSWHADRWRPR